MRAQLHQLADLIADMLEQKDDPKPVKKVRAKVRPRPADPTRSYTEEELDAARENLRHKGIR